jgi:hypothetical protein
MATSPHCQYPRPKYKDRGPSGASTYFSLSTTNSLTSNPATIRLQFQSQPFPISTPTQHSLPFYHSSTMGVDGLYFLDCFKDDGEVKSAIAFYKNFQRGANDNQFPDDITDAPSSPTNTLRFWETGSTQCMSSPNPPPLRSPCVVY